ncbi:MAG: hypothetical protein QGG39_12800 [Candidatus Poribacteria bacterium]|jgi:hypothetical protein|nr:hypothetical protein [Candidatus Poribacteria bacterium]
MTNPSSVPSGFMPRTPVVAGPEYRAVYAQYSEDEQHYYGCVTAVDDQVGRLHQTLEKLGAAENDHCLKVAFLHWPGQVEAGQVVDMPCSTLDYFPHHRIDRLRLARSTPNRRCQSGTAD